MANGEWSENVPSGQQNLGNTSLLHEPMHPMGSRGDEADAGEGSPASSDFSPRKTTLFMNHPQRRTPNSELRTPNAPTSECGVGRSRFGVLPRSHLRLQILILILILILISIPLLLLTGCASSSQIAAAPLTRFEFTQPQMGVPFRLVLYATNAAQASEAATHAFARISALNGILSDYDPDSELSRVCRDTPVGQPVVVSPELWHMLKRSQDLARRTDGAFDATVGPLANLWRRARRRGELPSEALLDEARSRTGWQRLRLDSRRHTVTFLVPNMRLDFGAIAKGYAADEALAVLRGHGLRSALVAAAGDMTAGDPPPGQPGWRVEVGRTDLTNGPAPRIIWLHHGAAATSGDLFQRLDIGGRRYSHILDPRTGIGLTDHSLVTVLAPDGTTADSLSTAVSVLGPERGLNLVDRTPDAAALVIRAPDGKPKVRESRRWRRWIAPTEQQ